jgi:hypothetical protein
MIAMTFTIELDIRLRAFCDLLCDELDAVAQTPARVNVTCVTPLGDDVASTS